MVSISTSRLSLRPIDESDREFLEELQRRPEVRTFIGALAIPEPGRGDHILTILKQETRVGVVGIVKSGALEGQDVELLCVLALSAERNGFATEACRAILSWAAASQPWKRILACVSDDNPDSRALLDRLGFRKLQRRPMRDEDIFTLPLVGAA
jgi:RimJ/RimL family protein N-acetyltransferase